MSVAVYASVTDVVEVGETLPVRIVPVGELIVTTGETVSGVAATVKLCVALPVLPTASDAVTKIACAPMPTPAKTLPVEHGETVG